MNIYKVLRAGVAAGLLFLLGACALAEDQIDLAYQPADVATQVQGADAVTVRVTATDTRLSNRDKVSVKKNGYGMEMAAIRANQDVPELVRAAVEQELEARGFRTGDGPVFTLIEVSRFYADYKTGFWSADNVGDVQLNVQVRDADGQMYYGKGISGVGKVDGVMIMGGGPVKQSLEAGLADAVRALMRDDFFIQSLIEAQDASRPQPAKAETPTEAVPTS